MTRVIVPLPCVLNASLVAGLNAAPSELPASDSRSRIFPSFALRMTNVCGGFVEPEHLALELTRSHRQLDVVIVREVDPLVEILRRTVDFVRHGAATSRHDAHHSVLRETFVSVNVVSPYAITVTGFAGCTAPLRAMPAATRGIKARRAADMARQATPAA